jgi:high affinity Mn2+ porin
VVKERPVAIRQTSKGAGVEARDDQPGLPLLTLAAILWVGQGAWTAALADPPPTDDSKSPPWAVHVQATDVMQYHPDFRSPYQGTNSFLGTEEVGNTLDASLFFGLRPWGGAQVWLDMDMNQGFAPSNTVGVAGYVNGEGAKVGHKSPYYRPQRFFFRQTIDLGGGADNVDPDMFEFGGKTTKNRLVFTVGKFGLPDVMDDNAYAHDPKNDFLNWALIDTGSFDYAADAWGFSYGAIAEWYQGDWTLRGGVMDLSTVPNDAHLTSNLGQFQLDGEVEYRENWLGREGKIKLLGFASRGRMGRFDDAVSLAEATDTTPDTSLVRHYRTRAGISLNVEQPVSDDAGLFLRAGWDQGQYESYEYTDIDATVAAGGSITGARWGRKDDTAALALVVNGISKAHQAYLAAGGLGILVGDGRLPHPGAEMILETYYSLGVIKGVHLTVDSQTVVNPAYNRDRGPVEVIGVRLHGQY